MNSTRSILISGASGLLGRSVSQILSQDSDVYALVRSSMGIQSENVRCIVADLENGLDIALLPKKIDVVVHLAQSSKFRDFPDSALDVFNVNISSTACLLDYARQAGASQFIYASSGGIYGNGSVAFKEIESMVQPSKLGYYLGSKACGEILAQSYSSTFQVTVVRPFFMYGPGQNRNMLIPRLMDCVVEEKPISLQQNDGICINPVHVEDASSALVATLNTTGSAIFNVAGPDVLSIRQIAQAMGEYLGKTPIFEHLNSHRKDLIADITLMRDQLWIPKRKLLDSLHDVST